MKFNRHTKVEYENETKNVTYNINTFGKYFGKQTLKVHIKSWN